MSDDPTTTTGEKPRNKAASLAGLAALVAVLATGGWGAYHTFVKGAPQAVGNDFVADPAWGSRRAAQRNLLAAVAPSRPQEAVTVSPGQVVVVRGGGLVMTAAGRANGTWRLNFNHRGQGATPDPQAVALLQQRRSIVESKSPPAGVTEAQKAALAAMPSYPPELSQASADRVVELCKQLTKMPAADAKAAPLKTELEQIITSAGKGDRNAIVATYAERATQIRAILPPDVVDRLLNNRPAAKPAAAPVAAPAPAAAPPA